MATRPGVCAAAASADAAAGRPSATSPISAPASNATSRAGLAAAPAVVPSAPARSAIRVRSVCQGSAGAASPRTSASRAGRSGPSPARVPAAPPSWTASRCRRTSASRRPAASMPAIQPAASRPNVTGTVRCSTVRPAISVSRWAWARWAVAFAAPARSVSRCSSARDATSMPPVSDHRVAALGGDAAERGDVEAFRPAGRRDGLGGGVRNQPDLGLHPGQGGLDREQGGEPRGVGHGVADRAARQRAVEEPGRLRTRRRPSHMDPGGERRRCTRRRSRRRRGYRAGRPRWRRGPGRLCRRSGRPG